MKAIKRTGFILVTLIVALFVFAPMFAAANTNNSSPTYNVNDPEKKFVCAAYTRNTVQPNGKLTDNEAKYSNTTVLEDHNGFTIKAGEAFKEKLVLGNGLLGVGGNMGSDSHTIIMKRSEVPGALYFMIYTFANEKDPQERMSEDDSPIKDLTVLGQCARKQ